MKHLMIVSAMLALCSNAVAANLLFNGNLDQTYQQVIIDNAPAGPGTEDFYLLKPLGWVNDGSRTLAGAYEDELESTPWSGPSPTPVTADGPSSADNGVFFKPFSGGSFNGPATGHLYQDVAATVGTTYQLTGWAGAEANALMADAEIALEFLDAGGTVIGGDVVDLLPTLFVDNGLSFDYKEYTATAAAPAGTVLARARVSMIGASGNPIGGGQAFVVDDFALTAVPEPAGLAFLAAGALALRRRRIA